MNTKVTAYAFDDFVLNIGSRTLTFRDRPVRLTPKAFQTLLVLLREHGRVVDKEYFLQEVWPDTFVEESTLAQNIRTLRKALAKLRKDKEFIGTVPRRGYRFLETVEEVSSGKDQRDLGINSDLTEVSGSHNRRSDAGHTSEYPDGSREFGPAFYVVMDVENGEQRLWRVSTRGDKPVRLTNRATRSVKMSPDGTKLACSLWDLKMRRMVLTIVCTETCRVLASLPTPPNDNIPFLEWSSDGDKLYAALRHADAVALWEIPINGDGPVQLREPRDELNLRLAISKDGQRISYEILTT